MIIEYNRIILRPLEPKDAEDLFDITHDPSVLRYVPNAYCESQDEALSAIVDYYAQGDFIHDFYYAIISSDLNHKMVGALIVTQNLEQEFEVSNIVASGYRGRGIIKNALTAFINSMPKGSKLAFFVKKDNQISINSLHFLKVNTEPCEDPDAIKFVYTV